MSKRSNRNKANRNNKVIKEKIVQATIDSKNKEVEEQVLSQQTEIKSKGLEQNVVLPENGSNQMDNVNKALEKMKRYADVIGCIWPIILVLLPFSYKIIEYVWNWGKYDFWNVPVNYIGLKMNELLLYFIAICLFLVVILAFGYLICYYILFFKIKNKFWNFFKGVGVGVFVYAICLAGFVAFLHYTPPYYRIQTFTAVDWWQISKFAFVVFVLFFTSTFLYGLALFWAGLEGSDIKVFKFKLFKQKQIKVEKEDEEKYDKRIVDRVYKAWGILLIVIPTFVFALTFYNDGFDKSADASEVEIVIIDEKEYVIAGIYDGKWILKECTLNEEVLKINSSSYTFQEIGNYEILYYYLNKDTTLKDCMVDEL